MYAFEYYRPATVDEASRLLVEQPDARVLAGGQSLLPAMRLRLTSAQALVDLGAIKELSGIACTRDEVLIGAMTTHAQVAAAGLSGLSLLAAGIGDGQIRNRGTLGGSLANNDPAACYPAAVLALDATIVTDRRRLSCCEFFRGMYETALEQGEVLTAVSFPRTEHAAYAKFKQPASRFALVGVFVAHLANRVRVAVTGAGLSGVFRAEELEAALERSFCRDALRTIRVDPAMLGSDLHASAEYRSHLVTVMAAKAVDSIVGGGRFAIRRHAIVAG